RLPGLPSEPRPRRWSTCARCRGRAGRVTSATPDPARSARSTRAFSIRRAPSTTTSPALPLRYARRRTASSDCARELRMARRCNRRVPRGVLQTYLFVSGRTHAVALIAGVMLMSAMPAAAQPQAPLGHAGRWITDSDGRVVILHGVNVVYKVPPYAPDAAGF